MSWLGGQIPDRLLLWQRHLQRRRHLSGVVYARQLA
jgi:hypothetical protein